MSLPPLCKRAERRMLGNLLLFGCSETFYMYFPGRDVLHGFFAGERHFTYSAMRSHSPCVNSNDRKTGSKMVSAGTSRYILT